MPLAGHDGVVTGVAEDFGEGDGVFGEDVLVGGEIGGTGHVTNASLVGVEAGENGGARGAAAAGVVEVGEAQAVGGEGVEVGGFDFGAEAADVGEAHVVGEEDDDVGPRCARGCSVDRFFGSGCADFATTAESELSTRQRMIGDFMFVCVVEVEVQGKDKDKDNEMWCLGRSGPYL